MNEHDLARLLPVPPERDLPADRKQILQEHLMTELRQAEKTRTRTRRPQRRPVLVAGAVLAAGGGGPAPGGGAAKKPPAPQTGPTPSLSRYGKPWRSSRR